MGRKGDSGFALLEILIVVAIIAVLAGSAFYWNGLGGGANKSGALPAGVNDPEQIIQYASDTLHEYASATESERGALGELQAGISATPPTASPTPTSVPAPSSTLATSTEK